MPAPSLSQVNALPDLMTGHQYLVKFGAIPGVSGDTSNLALMCFNANLPGRSNETVDFPLPGGHVRKQRGRNMFPRVLSLSFYENINSETHRALLAWQEFVAGTESGNSQGYSNEYAIPVEISVFDTVGTEVMTYNLAKVLPADIPDTPLSAESSTGLQINAQFSYDTYTRADITPS